jgi:isoleucyl-tRNA synthetase
VELGDAMAETSNDYKPTILLPATEFPMQAKSAEREPARLAAWQAQELSRQILENRAGALGYVLHDGPPYANGDIHMGHALNKILKDIIVRYKTMTGHRAEYIPGWDCHGLPIEQKVLQKLGSKAKETAPAEFRRACHEYAMHWVDVQREQFKRLGIGGTWDTPYLTLDPQVESGILSAFRDLVAKGLVVKGFRPVYWDWVYQTALAEAEIEYETHTSDSVYVKFPIHNAAAIEGLAQFPDAALVIWTTTPWTLPANLGVALNAEFTYVVLAQKHESDAAGVAKHYVVAKELAEAFCDACKLGAPNIVGTVAPQALDRQTCAHPIFADKPSLIMLAGHVTLEAGTGCVHTAPGHGVDDFNLGREYGLPVFVPVDGAGRYTSEYPDMQGVKVFDANPKIIELLSEKGLLIGHAKVTHQYPFSWRSHKPIIFRATEQWFMKLDEDPSHPQRTGVRERALKAIDDDVRWIPTWGRDRIFNMVNARPNWCLSRQRAWGVPIPAIHSKTEGKSILNLALIEKFIAVAREKGTDAWFTEPLDTFWPEGFVYEPTGESRPDQFEREYEVLDVWFDSGATAIGVLENKEKWPGLRAPADLYLEGSDQHRGWFQSSLLLGIGARGRAPYKAVLTHGFLLDAKGEAMSKSKGNTIAPQEVIKEIGADGLRLWVVSSDYRDDIALSKDILKRVGEAYRRIRNTLRFLLGNINGFDPKNLLPVSELQATDRWVLAWLSDTAEKVRAAYEEFEFHKIYHLLHNFCTIQVSSLYLDVVKDRLYCSGADAPTRRAAQTACWHLLNVLTRLLAPVLVFTSDEAWEFAKLGGSTLGDEASIHLADFPTVPTEWQNAGLIEQFEKLIAIRSEVGGELDQLRKAKQLGNSLQAAVTLRVEPTEAATLEQDRALLAELLLVAEVTIMPVEGFGELQVEIKPTAYAKCQRCWRYLPDVGADPSAPADLCGRCAKVVAAL